MMSRILQIWGHPLLELFNDRGRGDEEHDHHDDQDDQDDCDGQDDQDYRDDHDDRTGEEDGEAGSKSECTQYQSIVELL